MSFVDSYTDLVMELTGDVAKILEEETSEVVKDVMQEALADVVYSYEASDMAMQSRRYESGGLQDRANMVPSIDTSTDSPGWILTVENVAPFQDGREHNDDLSDVVDQGIDGYAQPKPRLFVSTTEDECITSGRALKSVLDGLRRRGYTMSQKAK